MAWYTPDQEILIGVIGVTGAGKTTFISRATGNNTLSIGRGLESCTQEIIPVPCTIDGTRVILIDTPGFDDTYQSDADIMQLIADYLATTYEKRIFLSGLILLHPITGNRLTGSERKRTALFKEIMGPGAYRRLIIGTTMWNQLRDQSIAERSVNERRMRTDCWRDMCERGAMVVPHDDTRQSAVRIVRQLMNSRGTVILKMQEELAANNRRIWRTSAGRRAMEDLGDEVMALTEKLERLEEERFQHRREIDELSNRLSNIQSQATKLRSGTGRILENFAMFSSATVPILTLLAGSGLACTIL